jgi:hypothetical protein
MSAPARPFVVSSLFPILARSYREVGVGNDLGFLVRALRPRFEGSLRCLPNSCFPNIIRSTNRNMVVGYLYNYKIKRGSIYHINISCS